MRPSLRRAATWIAAPTLAISACSSGEQESNPGNTDNGAATAGATSPQDQDPTTETSAVEVALPDPPGQLVDVDGHQMHLFCAGEGSPTVLLEAGGGGFSLGFSALQEELSDTTRVCSYDRSGLGWSDQGPEPRTGTQIVSELEALLDIAQEPGPYVLAGHSLGGPLILIFAQQNPQDVAGVVLIDASHPKQEEALAGQFPQIDAAYREFEAQREEIGAQVTAGELDVGDMIPLTPPALPLRAREQMAALILQPRTWQTFKAEDAAFTQTLAQVAGEGSLGDIPLVVLVAGLGLDGEMPAAVQQRFGVTDEDVDRYDAIWRNLQEDYLTLSTNSRLMVAKGSSHYIHYDEEEVVVDAIESLLATG